MTTTPCPRNLPQHFNGCACVAPTAQTPEADVDLDATAEGAAFESYYDSVEQCRYYEAHLTDVDEDGYCNFCGHDDPDDGPEQATVGDIAKGDVVIWNGQERKVSYVDRGQYSSRLGFNVNEATHRIGHDEPIERVSRGADFVHIENEDHRKRVAEYATRFTGPRPERFNFEPDWSKENQVQKAARDLAPGDRLLTNQVITRVDQRNGSVFVYTGGADPKGKADHWYNHGDPIITHVDRVDLSDPDFFEIEVRRDIADRVSYAEDMTNDASYVMPEEERAAMALAIRTRMARATQPGNISPIVNMNVDAADGRAKIGDNVIFSQPMHGDSSYEVIGKMAAVDIQGHDGTGVVWGETGGVEYVLKDLETGKQTTSDLRQHMWRRIPAPGDMGVAHQVIAQSRPAPTERELNEAWGV